VRPQPRQKPWRASTVQILTQGVSIIGPSRSRIERDHKRRPQEGNRAIVARLKP